MSEQDAKHLATLRALLEEAMEPTMFGDGRGSDAPDPDVDAVVAAIGDYGYGAIMCSASRLWRKYLKEVWGIEGAEFVVGTARSLRDQWLEKARKALAEVDMVVVPDTRAPMEPSARVTALQDLRDTARSSMDALAFVAAGAALGRNSDEVQQELAGMMALLSADEREMVRTSALQVASAVRDVTDLKDAGGAPDGPDHAFLKTGYPLDGPKI